MADLIIGMTVNLAISIALGLIPFFIAKNKQAIKFGVSALVLCAIAGLVVGVLGSVPIAIVLGIMALAMSPERLKSLGEKEAGGKQDGVIIAAFIILAIGILVLLAIQVDAI